MVAHVISTSYMVTHVISTPVVSSDSDRKIRREAKNRCFCLCGLINSLTTVGRCRRRNGLDRLEPCKKRASRLRGVGISDVCRCSSVVASVEISDRRVFRNYPPFKRKRNFWQCVFLIFVKAVYYTLETTVHFNYRPRQNCPSDSTFACNIV